MTTFQTQRKGLDVTVGLKRTNTVTDAYEIPNLAQVQAIAEGLASTKEAVSVCSEADVDIATGGLLLIEGYQTVSGDRVLLRGQTDATENGIYDAVVGTWSRSADADEQAELKPGTTVRVLSGTHSGRVYQLMNSTNPVPDTDAQTWSVIAASSDDAVDVDVVDTAFTQITGTDAQTVFDSIDDSLQTLVDARSDSRYTSGVTTLTSGTGIVFTHNLGQQYLPSVKVFDSTTDEDLTAALTIAMTSANTLTVTNDAANVDVILSAMK